MNEIDTFENNPQMNEFKPIYNLWQESANYKEPDSPNHYIEIIKHLASVLSIGSRELQTKLKEKGLTLKRSEINKYLSDLESLHLVTSRQRSQGMAYQLNENYGRKFYTWLNVRNESQKIQPDDKLNDYQTTFEEILGFCKDEKKLPKDQKYCGNPLAAIIRVIGSEPYEVTIRRDRIHRQLQLKKYLPNIGYDDMTGILDLLEGNLFIKKSKKRGERFVPEYSLIEKGKTLYSYLLENCGK